LHNNAVSRLVRLLADYLTQSQDQGTLYVPRAGIVKGPNSWLDQIYSMWPLKRKRLPIPGILSI
jgi:hypothetical protein